MGRYEEDPCGGLFNRIYEELAQNLGAGQVIKYNELSYICKWPITTDRKRILTKN